MLLVHALCCLPSRHYYWTLNLVANTSTKFNIRAAQSSILQSDALYLASQFSNTWSLDRVPPSILQIMGLPHGFATMCPTPHGITIASQRTQLWCKNNSLIRYSAEWDCSDLWGRQVVGIVQSVRCLSLVVIIADAEGKERDSCLFSTAGGLSQGDSGQVGVPLALLYIRYQLLSTIYMTGLRNIVFSPFRRPPSLNWQLMNYIVVQVQQATPTVRTFSVDPIPRIITSHIWPRATIMIIHKPL